MKTLTAKRAAGAGVGAAFAASTLAALTPLPAMAAGTPSIIVAKAPGSNVLAIGIQANNGVGATLRFHDGPGSSIVFDANVPIYNYYAPECVIAPSGISETCPNVTSISVSGSPAPDDIGFNTAGHDTVVNAGAGADVLHGSAAEHDEFHANKGGDTMYVENGDFAGCGLNDAGTGPDSQVDTIYYNGTPTFKNCNFSGAGVHDVAIYSNKA